MLFDQKANLDTGGISGSGMHHYESKVNAPRNPTLNRGPKIEPKVDKMNAFEKAGRHLSLSVRLVHTFHIFKRNVTRHSTEINEYQRNVPTENHRSL